MLLLSNNRSFPGGRNRFFSLSPGTCIILTLVSVGCNVKHVLSALYPASWRMINDLFPVSSWTFYSRLQPNAIKYLIRLKSQHGPTSNGHVSSSVEGRIPCVWQRVWLRHRSQRARDTEQRLVEVWTGRDETAAWRRPNSCSNCIASSVQTILLAAGCSGSEGAFCDTNTKHDDTC